VDPKLPALQRRAFAVAFAALLLGPSVAWAATPAPTGSPTVVIESITLPPHSARDRWVAKLRKGLRREIKRLDWGASKGNTIQLRFEVSELKIQDSATATTVQATLIGRLPGGQHAKSSLSFGGRRGHGVELAEQVLDILAQGIVARLAEMERRRRGLR
jgi:hypothetical protein